MLVYQRVGFNGMSCQGLVHVAQLRREFRDAFRIIAWNFPHLGAGEKDVEKNNEQHRYWTGIKMIFAICDEDVGVEPKNMGKPPNHPF